MKNTLIKQQTLPKGYAQNLLAWAKQQSFETSHINRPSPLVCWWGNANISDGCDRLISDDSTLRLLVNEFHPNANCAALWKYRAEFASPDRLDPPGQKTVGIILIDSPDREASVKMRWNKIMHPLFLKHGDVVSFNSSDLRSFYCTPFNHYFLELRVESAKSNELVKQQIIKRVVENLPSLEIHHLLYLEDMSKKMNKK